MALLRYLQVLPHCGQLPDPTGPLSSSLPSSAIDEANASARQYGCQEELAMNATLFLHTSLFPPSDFELLDLLK